MLFNYSLKVLPIPFGDSTFLCDVSSSFTSPLVPTSLRKELFSTLNGISHPEIQASRRLISSWFVWPSMANYIGIWSHRLHSMSAEQDTDTHQILNTKYSGSWKVLCSCSHQPCRVSSLSLQPFLYIEDDLLHLTVARGHTINLNICLIWFMSLNLHLGITFWCACSVNL